MRRLFNKCQVDNNLHSWELYREAQQRYRKEVRKGSKETWRTYCSSVNDLPRSARIYRAVYRDPKIRLRSFVAPSGRHTQSKGETLDLSLDTHFPNSIVIERRVVPTAACRAKCLDWWVAVRIVAYRRMGWATDSFAPHKSPGMDRIFPALPQEGWEVLIPYLVKIFRACLATGYVPAMWRQVKVVFIPKPGRNSYCGPRDYRPISLTSFLLKTMDRLVDRFLKNEILALKPRHPNQHAY